MPRTRVEILSMCLLADPNDSNVVVRSLLEVGVPEGAIQAFNTREGRTRIETLDLKPEDREEIERNLGQDGTVILVRATDENMSDRVEAVFDAYRERNETADTQGNQQIGRGTGDTSMASGETLPVIEEELKVGKRAVQTGRVRVFSRVSTRPVEESVDLEQERVKVSRRPVQRDASEEELISAENRSVELPEMAEEAVVEKRAKVVEEVSVETERERRTEAIRDDLRSTEIEVEHEKGEEEPQVDPKLSSGKKSKSQRA